MISKRDKALVLRLSPKAVTQTLLIYFMMLMNQSVIRDAFFPNSYIVFAVALVFATIYGFYQNRYITFFLVLSLAICTFTRLFIGGVGIGIWVSWASFILITYSAIEADPNCFLDRFVKIVVFFAAASLFFWGLSRINTTLVQKLMLFHYKMRTNFARDYIDSIRYNKIFYDAYGGLIYCVNMCHPTRNCGIYTEPGIYQMVLNSALFVILYMKDHISIDRKKQYRYTVLLILTIISTQSTTGILSLAVLLFAGLFKRRLTKFQRRLLYILVVMGLFLGVQYVLQGTNSILYTTVIKKLFKSSGQFSLAASSGSARVGTMIVCAMSMLRKPFGIGYDRVMELLNSDVTGYVAASIFLTGAACGVAMFFLIISWIVAPFLKSHILSQSGKIVFILIYFNTILAQSSEFYPFLIFMPIFLRIYAMKNKPTKHLRFIVRR